MILNVNEVYPLGFHFWLEPSGHLPLHLDGVDGFERYGLKGLGIDV